MVKTLLVPLIPAKSFAMRGPPPMLLGRVSEPVHVPFCMSTAVVFGELSGGTAMLKIACGTELLVKGFGPKTPALLNHALGSPLRLLEDA
jgi:hypothetical protein